MEIIKSLEVLLEDKKVGTLALTSNRQAVFQYAP